MSDNVTVLLNNGSADFTAQAPEDLNSSIDPHDLAVANLGGDANLDLAIANSSGPTSFADRIGIMIGDGTGNFTDAPTSPESAASTLPGTQIVAGDFNGSGGPDLAVTNTGTDDVTTLLNSGGAGDFVAAGPPEAVGDTPTAIVTADVNNDAKTDLVVANSVADNVSVLLGNGAGDFAAAPSSPEATGDFPAAIAVGSLGGNASADLAVANSFSDNVTILLNEFAAPVVPPPGGGSPATPVTPITPATPAPATAKAKKKCKKKKKKKGQDGLRRQEEVLTSRS